MKLDHQKKGVGESLGLSLDKMREIMHFTFYNYLRIEEVIYGGSVYESREDIPEETMQELDSVSLPLEQLLNKYQGLEQVYAVYKLESNLLTMNKLIAFQRFKDSMNEKSEESFIFTLFSPMLKQDLEIEEGISFNMYKDIAKKSSSFEIFMEELEYLKNYI